MRISMKLQAEFLKSSPEAKACSIKYKQRHVFYRKSQKKLIIIVATVKLVTYIKTDEKHRHYIWVTINLSNKL